MKPILLIIVAVKKIKRAARQCYGDRGMKCKQTSKFTMTDRSGSQPNLSVKRSVTTENDKLWRQHWRHGHGDSKCKQALIVAIFLLKKTSLDSIDWDRFSQRKLRYDLQ